MIVKIELDPKIVWKLGAIAEKAGMGTVAELLASQAAQLVADPVAVQAHPLYLEHPTKGKRRPTYDHADLDRLIREGQRLHRSDKSIAAGFGCSEQTVRNRRNRLGLPSAAAIGRPRKAEA